MRLTVHDRHFRHNASYAAAELIAESVGKQVNYVWEENSVRFCEVLREEKQEEEGLAFDSHTRH